jgi:hypothetical protein
MPVMAVNGLDAQNAFCPLRNAQCEQLFVLRISSNVGNDFTHRNIHILRRKLTWQSAAVETCHVFRIISIPTQLNLLVLAKCMSFISCRRLTAGYYASTVQISWSDIKLGLSRGYCRPVPVYSRFFAVLSRLRSEISERRPPFRQHYLLMGWWAALVPQLLQANTQLMAKRIPPIHCTSPPRLSCSASRLGTLLCPRPPSPIHCGFCTGAVDVGAPCVTLDTSIIVSEVSKTSLKHVMSIGLGYAVNDRGWPASGGSQIDKGQILEQKYKFGTPD